MYKSQSDLIDLHIPRRKSPGVTGISAMPEAERPYERLEQEGVEALSDGELLAILLQSGTRQMTSLELARELLRLCEPRGLAELSRWTQAQFMQLHGIGRVKAARLQAAFELGRRAGKVRPQITTIFNSPEHVNAHFYGSLGQLEREEVHALFLTTRQTFIKETRLGQGSLNQASLDLREIIKQALLQNAAGVILVHNHPSGDPSPSLSDHRATARLNAGLLTVGIQLVDHVIIARDGFYSYRRNSDLLGLKTAPSGADAAPASGNPMKSANSMDSEDAGNAGDAMDQAEEESLEASA